MKRPGQKLFGGVALALGGLMLAGHYLTDHAPAHTELWIGAGLVALAAGLLVPVGLADVLGTLAPYVPFLETPDEEEDCDG